MRRVLVFSGIASLGCAGIFAANAESRRRLQCGVASIQGRREYQEDRFVASPDDGVFAVFDGHGGSLTSETASKVFLKVLKDALSRRKGELDEKVWNEAFEVTEANYRLVSAGVSDSNGSKRSEGREGSTACAAMIDRFNVLSVANAGDSRCVVCTKKGAAFAMSVDHKPDDEPELKRLQANGYKVVRGRIYEVSSGRGGLNLSRALGDFHYRGGVPCTPDVKERALGKDDALVVLGTDGLYDVFSNEQVCKIALSKSDPTESAKELVAKAFDHGSQDNITAIVVKLL